MINSINGFGGYSQQVQQDPNEYAKVYAEQNGLSVEEAKAELKSKYGDPEIGSSNTPFSFNVNTESQDITSIENELQELEAQLFGNQSESNFSFFETIMNFFKGNNETNDNSYINPETGSITGPQKKGDPQPHLGQNNGIQQKAPSVPQQPSAPQGQTNATNPFFNSSANYDELKKYFGN